MPDRIVSESIQKYQKAGSWYIKYKGQEYGPMNKEAADRLEEEFRRQR